MAHKILHDFWTECSACGGNTDPHETSHIHGGPHRGSSNGPSDPDSTLMQSNGCRAEFDAPAVLSMDAHRTRTAMGGRLS